ncbi:glycosyl hydrolase family 28-related protein [Cohnella sp. REN36]|uniref:glycosyl hydrolase family 28-related protein n=1 Tax=Cohnella sp. REN36 TaxID=2887347 RepID=UPI001D158B67|nr:glycosyl hydrolase family 28-related protein [Cohnella sp. REN36]MCC3372619.1 hypothetical protein [Cohnella sp. REN36]
MKKNKLISGNIWKTLAMIMVLAVTLNVMSIAPGFDGANIASAMSTGNTALKFTVTNDASATANRYVYQTISTASYTTQPGDRLEYDVYLPDAVSGAGGLDFYFTSPSAGVSKYFRDSNPVDSSNAGAHPAADLTGQAYDQWYHRTLVLNPGLHISNWMIAGENDQSGLTYTALYDNIQVVNTGYSNPVRLNVYQNGAPTVNSATFPPSGASGSLTTVSIQDTPDFQQPAGHALRFTVTNASGIGAKLSYRKISEGGRGFVFQSGDVIEYDVKLLDHRDNAGGIDLRTQDGLYFRNASGWKDQNNIDGHPANDISGYAYNNWYHRKLAVPPSMVGKSLDYWIVAGENTTPGISYSSLYDNLRVVRSGKTLVWGYQNGDRANNGNPFFNAISSESGVTSVSLSGLFPKALYLKVNNASSGSNKFAYYSFSNTAYTFASGDSVEYDVMLADRVNGAGGLDVCAGSSCARDAGWSDQNGISGHPASDLSPYAYGAWYHRKMDIPSSLVGQSSTQWLIAGENDTNGQPYGSYYANMVVTNGSTLKAVIFRGDQSSTPAMELTSSNAIQSSSSKEIKNPSFTAFHPQKVTPTNADSSDSAIISGFNVKDFNAAGDGLMDDTIAFKQALSAASRAGGGVVWVPAGTYKIMGQLTIPKSVVLQGDWKNPDSMGGLGSGTILHAYSGRGNPSAAPFLTVGPSAAVKGMTIYYPEQTDPSAIVAYPPTIRLQDNNFAYANVQNTTLVNAYDAIQGSPNGDQMHVLKNVYGTPLHLGISINHTTDVGRIQNVFFDPKYWIGYAAAVSAPTVNAGALNTALAGATGMTFMRTDWENVYNIGIVNYGNGIVLNEDGTASGPVKAAQAIMTKISITGANKGIVVNDVNYAGVMFAKCSISATSGTDPTGIEVAATHDSIVQFNGCTFNGSASQQARIASGSTGMLSIINSSFADWANGASNYAVTAGGGTLQLENNSFGKSQPAVNIGSGVSAAAVLSNTFTGTPQITNAQLSNPNIVVDHTARPFKPVPSDPDLGSAPNATGSAFAVVTDAPYNAAATDTFTGFDNTAAFQSALNTVSAAGGGIVYVPPGAYYLAGQLNVPSGVELRGVFEIPHHTTAAGSVLYTTANAGNENATPFVTLQQNAGIRGVTVVYPDQDLTSTSAVKAYPWTIRAASTGAWAINVTLPNTFRGLDFSSNASGGHYIDHVNGAALKTGIAIGNSSSVGRILNAHFNPTFYFASWGSYLLGMGDFTTIDYNTRVGTLFGYQDSNLIGFDIGKTTNETLFHSFVYRGNIGLHLYPQGTGSFEGSIYGFGAESVTPLDIESIGSGGLTLLGGTFNTFGGTTGRIRSTVSPSASITLQNAQFYCYNCSPSNGLVVQNGNVTIQQNHIAADAAGSNGGVRISGGTVNVLASAFSKIGPLSGSAFTVQSGVKDVVVDSGVTDGLAAGNAGKTGFMYTNNGSANFVSNVGN